MPAVGLAGGVYSACEGKINEAGDCVGETKEVCYEGLVPCGKPVMLGGELKNGKCSGGAMTKKDGKEAPLHCQLCHFFVMIDGIIDFVLTDVVPPVAVLMLVIGGVMFYFGGGKPELLGRAKTLLKAVVIGLLLIYGAYMIVGIFLSVLGAAEVESVKGVFEHGVFSIKCLVELPQ